MQCTVMTNKRIPDQSRYVCGLFSSLPCTATRGSLEADVEVDLVDEDKDCDIASTEDTVIELPALALLVDAEARFKSLPSVDYCTARKASNEDRKRIEGGMQMQVCM